MILRILDKGYLLILFCCLAACGPETPSELPEVLMPTEEGMLVDSAVISCVALHYQYTDHQKFLSWINGADSLRKSYGLHNHSVLRLIEDTTRVLELLTVDNMARGNDFAISTHIKNITDTYGFLGRPTVYLLNAVQMADKGMSSTCMLLQHDVRNFQEWKAGFEKYNAGNENGNVRALCLFSTYRKPNKVSVLMEIKSVEIGKELVSNPEIIATIRSLGAITEPKMTLLEVWR